MIRENKPSLVSFAENRSKIVEVRSTKWTTSAFDDANKEYSDSLHAFSVDRFSDERKYISLVKLLLGNDP